MIGTTAKKLVVFDAYGTLFDVTAAARRGAAEPGGEVLAEVWPAVARNWRERQLRYSWVRTITGAYADFETVTADALDWALEAAGLAKDETVRTRLLALYHELDVFPEVPGMLRELRAAGCQTAILSNGSAAMLDDAVTSAGLSGAFDAVLSVDAVGAFKPAREVYDLVGARFGVEPAEVLFVSANGWDAGGAAAYGFESVWINRTLDPVDRLPGRPARVLADLGPVPGLATDPTARWFKTSDGLAMAYWDQGEGLPVLCLPGLTRNSEDFLPLVEHFGQRARIIRLDARGRGASQYDLAYLNYNVLREARDALELLDHLGIDKALVFGSSRGGMLAMMIAGMAPDRLAGVVLNDIGPVIDQGGIARIMSYLGVSPVHRTLDAAAAAMTSGLAEQFPGVGPEAWKTSVAKVWRETSAGLSLRYDARLRQAVIEQASSSTAVDLWPLFDRLAEIPLMVIRGQFSDILPPEVAEEMRNRRPDMEYVMVRDRGHLPFLDEPELIEAFSRFLDLVRA